MTGAQLERTYRAAMKSGVPAHIEYFCEPYDVWLDTHVFPMDGKASPSTSAISPIASGAELLRDAASNQLHAGARGHHGRRRQRRPLRQLHLPQPPRHTNCSPSKAICIGKNISHEFPQASNTGRLPLSTSTAP